MQSWILPVIGQVIFSFVILPPLNKLQAAHEQTRTQRILWAYLAAFSTAFLVSAYVGLPKANLALVIMIGIGIVNGIANYCYWRGLAISMSKTSMTAWLDDFIAVALGWMLLSEQTYLGWQGWIGLILCFSAVLILLDPSHDSTPTPKTLLPWVLGYSCLWGVTLFVFRVIAVQQVPITTMAVGFYGGALITAIGLFVFRGPEERGQRLPPSQVGQAMGLGVLYISVILFHFKAKALAPITVVQPILLVSEMILPTLIGLSLFREGKQLQVIQKIAFGLGGIGAILLGLGYHAP